jgi:hypothetical protein
MRMSFIAVAAFTSAKACAARKTPTAPPPKFLHFVFLAVATARS